MKKIIRIHPELGLLNCEIPIGWVLVKPESGKKMWHGDPRHTRRGSRGKFPPENHRNSGMRNGEKGRRGRSSETRGELWRSWGKLRSGCVCFNCNRPWRRSSWKLPPQDPVGFLGTKTFLYPPFLGYRKQTLFSLHDLPWVPMVRFKQLLIREGRACRDKGGAVQKQ